MQPLMISPLRTDIFYTGQDIVEFIIGQIDRSLWQENLILAVTSKIISLAESNLVNQNSIDKKELILKEADHYLGEIGYGVRLTIKNNLLVAAAGIDESNSENRDYILLPKNPQQSANSIRQKLCDHFNLKNLGIIVTDSRTGPLRYGVVGVSLATAGFEPLKNMIGEKDIFGRELSVTQINYADSLAAAAVVMMGEANERCPLALIQNAPVAFTAEPQSQLNTPDLASDMYYPLYEHLIKRNN